MFLVVLNACSSSNDSSSGNQQEEAKMSAEKSSDQVSLTNSTADQVVVENQYGGEQNASTESVPQEKKVDSKRKIIREQSIEQQVQDLKKVMGYVEQQINNIPGAYIESLQEWKEEQRNYKEYRAMLVLRVPVQQYEAFLAKVENQGNITRRQVSGQDVTAEFIDNESRLRNFKKHEERILQLYDKAEKIEDMLKIENELSRIRESIEQLEGRQKFLNEVTSTVKLTLELFQVEKAVLEVNQENTSLLKESWIGFTQSIQDIKYFLKRLLVVLITIVPYLFLLSLPLALFILFLRKKAKKKPDQNM